jgi:uncharacterized protein
MYKKRLISHKINKFVHHKNALIITGMRQVGKTSLMKEFYQNIKEPKYWFDFDNPLDIKIFEELDYNNIYKNLYNLTKLKKKERMYIFIDEIQNYPEITKIVKYLIDHYQLKFFLTGSSNFYLKNLFPESLSGRKFLFQLKPLSFQEFLFWNNELSYQELLDINFQKLIKNHSLIKAEKLKLLYQEYLDYGGFPEVVLTSDKETKIEILKNIFASFFEKDLKILSDYKDIKELRDLIILLAPRVGSLMDITKLASELSLTRPKIYSYLEFLQAIFFIKLIPKYSKNLDKTIAGRKKLYFSDTGILQMISPVNTGQLLENAVVNQLDFYGDLSFYNQRNTKEIDIILNKKTALEIKLSAGDYDKKNLEKLSQNLGLKEYFVVSKKYINKPNFISPLFI